MEPRATEPRREANDNKGQKRCLISMTADKSLSRGVFVNVDL